MYRRFALTPALKPVYVPAMELGLKLAPTLPLTRPPSLDGKEQNKILILT